MLEAIKKHDPALEQEARQLVNVWDLLKQAPNETVYLTESKADAEFLTDRGLLAIPFIQNDGSLLSNENALQLSFRKVIVTIPNTPESIKRAEQAKKAIRGDCRTKDTVFFAAPDNPGETVKDWFNQRLQDGSSLSVEALKNGIDWDCECLADVWDDPPPLDPELIYNVLRQGHKMSLSGSSKAGKSFALLQLAAAFAEGRKWFDTFECKQSKVVYLNLEISRPSIYARVKKVYAALQWPPDGIKNLFFANLRGRTTTIEDMEKNIIKNILKHEATVVIFDPIYKMGIADENNAFDVAKFCQALDRIMLETGVSVIYCHHFTKGGQSGKNAIDRASGSGVFARDPDAIITLTDLQEPNGARLEMTLREFSKPDAISIRFEHPIHRIAPELADCPLAGERRRPTQDPEKIKEDNERKKDQELAEIRADILEYIASLKEPEAKTKLIKDLTGVVPIGLEKSRRIVNSMLATGGLIEQNDKANNNQKLITIPKPNTPPEQGKLL